MRWFVLLALLLPSWAMAQVSNGHTLSGTEQFPLIPSTSAYGSVTASDIANFVSANTGNLFLASAQSACVWNTTNDVGPCINAAIAAAAAAGGGTVVIPAGIYNLATAIVNNTSGVHLQGAGTGIPRDTQSSSNYLAVTRLVWTGVSGATMLTIAPSSTSAVTLYSVDVKDIVFDCALLANVCAEVNNTYGSVFKFGVSEPRSVGAYVLVDNDSDGPGAQDNHYWIESRSTSTSTYCPTGIMVDSTSGSTWNVSENRFDRLYAWYGCGDGIVLGNSDNNTFYDIAAYPNPGATGSPIVAAAKGYSAPNGVTTNGYPYANRFIHTASIVNVQGYPSGATLTAGSNTGTVSFSPLSLTTSSTPSAGSINLSFASTTGVASWMDTKCGNPSNGVPNDVAVSTVVSSTLLQLVYPLTLTPSGNITCTFGWGTTSTAVAGTYTITAASTSTYNITAPSGGHSQSGISASGGVLAFTDIVLPISGTPATSDSWTLVIPGVSYGMNFEFLDKANSVPNPHFGVGASGSFSASNQPWPTSANASVGINMPFYTDGCGGKIQGAGAFAVNIGNCAGNGTTGTYSVTIGGTGNGATGFGAFTGGGNSNAVPGTYSAAFGQGTSAGGTSSFAEGLGATTTGNYSFSGGAYPTDRGRTAADCRAGGEIAVLGDAQICGTVLSGTGSSGSAIRLTSGGGTAGSANCVNMPTNSAYQLVINIMAFDHTTITKNEAWSLWSGLMTEGATASTAAITMATTPTPITNGTVTGSSISATADTTNGCLNLSFTPPTSNTDKWNVVARVETVEVQ